ncbi:MAG: hypothetical protein WDM81_03385 [Rhizomicrobium sp.]
MGSSNPYNMVRAIFGRPDEPAVAAHGRAAPGRQRDGNPGPPRRQQGRTGERLTLSVMHAQAGIQATRTRR